MVTWVYGDPNPASRVLNWETLRHIWQNRVVTWICAGDFNDIAHYSEKIGGRRKDQYKIDNFTALIEDIHMEDLGYKGQMHTWSNNKRGADRIVERLDRFLGNMGWCQLYTNAQCINELAIGSYHSPVELVLDYNDGKGWRRFRFEDMWMERQECFQLIKSAWERSGVARSIEDLQPKLAECKKSLIEWSRREFKNNIKEINKAREALRSMGTEF